MQSKKTILVGTNDTVSSITDTDNQSKTKQKYARFSTDGTDGTADTHSMSEQDKQMHHEEEPGADENMQNHQ